MNNGTYTLHAKNPTEVASEGTIEFPAANGNQKVLVFSGIALPAIGTDDEDDIGRPRVFVRLGRFVRNLIQPTSVTVGLASISNDESAFTIATDTALLARDDVTGELFLDVSCGLSGDGTYINRFGYQAVCVIEEDTFRIRGHIVWPHDLRDSSQDTPDILNKGVLGIRAGGLISVPGSTPGSFGTTKWEPYGTGSITNLARTGDGWDASYEIVNLPPATPITVLVDILPGFAPNAASLAGSRTSGPDPVVLSGGTPEVDDENFRVTVIAGPR